VADYRVVPFSPDHLDQVVDLHRESFGLTPELSRRYLHWKYSTNPYMPEPALFVAMDSRGSVVGMRGFYGTAWRMRGETVVVPCADDFAIRPADRNAGLMTQIMRVALDAMARRGFGQILNLSGGPVTVLQSLVTGWTSLGAMKPVARSSRTRDLRLALEKLPKTGRVWRWIRAHRPEWGAGGFDGLDRWAGDGPASARVTASSRPRPEDMAALAARMDRSSRVRHVRDAAYFDWRFENPMRRYRFIYHNNERGLNGYLIVNRMVEYAWPNILYHLVDWEAANDEVRTALLGALVEHGRLPAIGAWSGDMTDAERQLLTDSGFEDAELDLRHRGMPCGLLKSIGATAPRPLTADGAQWDIRLLDTMHG
jgi:GNAT superfamily N-acetyltransferase